MKKIRKKLHELKNRYKTLPIKTKQLLGLGVVLALLVALPLFTFSLVNLNLELRERAATFERPITGEPPPPTGTPVPTPTTTCWNKVVVSNNIYYWPDSCRGQAYPEVACLVVLTPLTSEEIQYYLNWKSVGGYPPLSPACYPTPTPTPTSTSYPRPTISPLPTSGLRCPAVSLYCAPGYTQICSIPDPNKCPVCGCQPKTPTPTPSPTVKPTSTPTPVVWYCQIFPWLCTQPSPTPTPTVSPVPTPIAIPWYCQIFPWLCRQPIPTPTPTASPANCPIKLSHDSFTLPVGQYGIVTAVSGYPDQVYIANPFIAAQRNCLVTNNSNQRYCEVYGNSVGNTTMTFKDINNSCPVTIPVNVVAGSPTPTPTPTPTNWYQTLKFRMKFAGVTGDGADGASVKARIVNPSIGFDQQTSAFTVSHVGGGIYEGTVSFENYGSQPALPVKDGYEITLKGEKHVARKFCRVDGQTSRCTGPGLIYIGATTVPSTQTFDFTGLALEPGDLPEQDGVVNTNDFNKVKAAMAKACIDLTDQEKLTADLDYSGCVNVKDAFLLRKTLETRYDEE